MLHQLLHLDLAQLFFSKFEFEKIFNSVKFAAV
jgi:hypothetical protein